MAVVALVCGKGSPGATTSALAMTLAWPAPVLLVEADPDGGDIVAGYLRGQVPAGRGLVQLAVAARREGVAAALAGQVLDIATGSARGSRLLLAGVAEPAQAATVAPIWGALAGFLTGGPDRTGPAGQADPPGATGSASLAGLAGLGGSGGPAGTGDRDVLVDCGRPAAVHAPWPLLAVADLVAVVLRPTLRSVSAARPVVAGLRAGLPRSRHARIRLLVVEGGEYRRAEVAHALDTPLLAALPWRPGEAAALSDGTGRVAGSSVLLRSARMVEAAVREQCAAVALAAAGGASTAAGPVTSRAVAGSAVPGSTVPGSAVPGSGVAGSAVAGMRPAAGGVTILRAPSTGGPR